MEEHTVKIKSIEKVTHDVLKITTTKPEGYNFQPGQATEVAVNKSGWTDKRQPFTFTCLPEDYYLEFTIKTYPERKRVTNELLVLKPDDELLLHDVFGAITYKGEGVFIAGGAGVTPFISIFRHLKSKNKIGNNMLVFANKTRRDIILETEFRSMLGNAYINILSEERTDGYHYGLINEGFLKSVISDFNRQFYVCGPPPMMEAVIPQLKSLGVSDNAVTVEL